MRRCFLFFLSSFIFDFSLAQGETIELQSAITKKDYHIAQQLASKLALSEIAHERAYGFWGLGVIHLSGNPDSASYFLDKALAEMPDDLLQIKILNAKANYFDVTGSTRKSISTFLEVVRRASKHDSSFLAASYNNLCISYRSLQQFDSAIFYGFKGLEIAENRNQKHERKRLLNSIAISFAVHGDLPTATTYFRKSLKQALQNQDSSGASKGFVNLTQVKIYQDDLDSAEFYLEQAKVYNLRNRNVLDIVDVHSLFAEIKLENGEPKVALNYLEEALDMLQGLGFPNEEIAILLSRARTHLELNGFSNSQLDLDKAMELIQQNENQSELLAAKKLQRELFARSNQLERALAIQAEMDSLAEVKYSQEKIRAVEDTRIRYETEKKEQQIINLEQQQEIAELRIRQQTYLLLVSGIVLIVAISFGYVFYRNRTLKLAKERLIVEQQLLRSQMNPHFLFNALSSIHTFIFRGDKKEAADYLATFGELTRDILDHSSRELITLKKELGTLNKYIEVQKLRFPKVRYNLKIKDDLEIENLLVPPMLLQPFVENSFEHGLNGQTSGNIELTISELGSELAIEVLDDGKGLNQNLSTHESKAIEMTRKRLEILFGKRKSSLSVTNRKGESGVLVSIVIPKNEAI